MAVAASAVAPGRDVVAVAGMGAAPVADAAWVVAVDAVAAWGAAPVDVRQCAAPQMYVRHHLRAVARPGRRRCAAGRR